MFRFLPEELDEKVAKLHLQSPSAELTVTTCCQAQLILLLPFICNCYVVRCLRMVLPSQTSEECSRASANDSSQLPVEVSVRLSHLFVQEFPRSVGCSSRKFLSTVLSLALWLCCMSSREHVGSLHRSIHLRVLSSDRPKQAVTCVICDLPPGPWRAWTARKTSTSILIASMRPHVAHI